MSTAELKEVLTLAFGNQIAVESIESRSFFTISAIVKRRFFVKSEYFKSCLFLPEEEKVILEMTLDQAMSLKYTIS